MSNINFHIFSFHNRSKDMEELAVHDGNLLMFHGTPRIHAMKYEHKGSRLDIFLVGLPGRISFEPETNFLHILDDYNNKHCKEPKLPLKGTALTLWPPRH